VIRKQESDGAYYYMLVDARQYSKNGFETVNRQVYGTCVLRTRDLSDPSSWRAWDGNAADDGQKGFTARLGGGYPVEPVTGGVCAPIDNATGPAHELGTGFIPRSLTYNTYFDKYMMVGNVTGGLPGDGQGHFNVMYTLSDDLVDWGPSRLIVRAPLVATYKANGCTGPDVPIVYPSLIDPSDTSTNFERSGQTANLYYLKLEDLDPATCTIKYPGVNNRFHRVPVRFGSAREASGRMFRCESSFDGYRALAPSSYFIPDGDRNYSGYPGSYRMTTDPIAAYAYGILTHDGEPPAACDSTGSGVKGPRFGFGESDEVTYSVAFAFPEAGFWSQMEAEPHEFPGVALLRLENPTAGGWAAMLTINKQRVLRFSTSGPDPATKKQILAPQVQLPRDECWHLIEVHQKFSSDPTVAVNEVWVDGVRKDVSLADDANFYGTAPYNEFRVGITSKANVTNPLTLFTDAAAFGYTTPRSPAHDPGRCASPD
jgi:hypothetical protein